MSVGGCGNCAGPKCLIPQFNGEILSYEWKESLWDKFVTGAPRSRSPLNVKRFHYDSHDQLRTHLSDFIDAHNFARRLRTLGGLTPYEFICKIWTSEPERFILNPIHQILELNT